ncbi:sarcosine oxidase subunit gamma [Roseovarius atlanticus]|uniref:Sarcosine oxidase subunit gamma n=1 Tax=Roseovarius atlanticus TaxID=1641875 RepID=A0A0T5NTX2_9RHOB|nr:sarcosine oxidase subunit gamma family protein [Roseovarius atlanticus]KRS12375.1 sarcosine oxidase subunit gamma [Roseovarius atlanticus]
MSKAVSALQGAVYQGYVEVREMGLVGMITLRGDLSSAKMKKAVKDACGVDLPGQREIAVAGEKGAAWMSPDELLLMVPYEGVADALAAVEAALSGEHFLAVNVSDARAVFQLKGAAAREIIAKLCPVDMAPGAFEPGMIRRTRMAQIAAAFWMVDAETIRVVCFRSVAEYAFNLLKDAAAPGGETGLFA